MTTRKKNDDTQWARDAAARLRAAVAAVEATRTKPTTKPRRGLSVVKGGKA